MKQLLNCKQSEVRNDVIGRPLELGATVMATVNAMLMQEAKVMLLLKCLIKCMIVQNAFTQTVQN